MIAILATLTMVNGSEQQIKTDLKELMEVVHKNEPNCLRYEMYVDSKNPLTIYSVELFTDHNAFDAHMDAPYLKAFIAKHANVLRVDVQEAEAL